MSETATAERVRMDDPFAGGMRFDQPDGAQTMLVPVQPATSGGASDRAIAEIITAQRVAVKRNLPAILAEAKFLATAAERKFYYSIPFKERGQDGGPARTVHVEGPSIDCAMAALSIYGNCRVEAFPANETQSHWTFMARFVDYEKGVTIMRAFNQRKSQSTGMKDAGRNLDIVFQIGQSKAIRNVIVAALKWLTDEMFAAAKSGVLARIEGKPEAAREWLARQFVDLEVSLARVERVVGRTHAKWLAPDMAKLVAELQGVRDGFADADDLWPVPGASGVQETDAGETATLTTKPPPPAEEKKAPPKTAPKPKAAPVASPVATTAETAAPAPQATPATAQATLPVDGPAKVAPPAAATQAAPAPRVVVAEPAPDPVTEEGDPEQADDPGETAAEAASDEPGEEEVEFN